MAKRKSTTISYGDYKKQNTDTNKGPVTYGTYKEQNADPSKGPVSFSTYKNLQAQKEKQARQQQIKDMVAQSAVQKARDMNNPFMNGSSRMELEVAGEVFGYGRQYTVENGRPKVIRESNPDKRGFIEWLMKLDKAKKDKEAGVKPQPKVTPVVQRSPEEIKTEYTTQKVNQLREAIADRALGFGAVEDSRKKNNTGNNWTLGQQFDIYGDRKKYQAEGLYGDSGLPWYMNDEQRKALREESEKKAKDLRTLAEQYENIHPGESAAGLFDYVHGLDVNNEQSIINNPAFKGTESERNASLELERLNSTYNMNRQNVSDQAENLLNGSMKLEGESEYEKQQIREEVYNWIMPDTYKNRTKDMNYEQTKALNDEIDKAIAGMRTNWESGNQADEIAKLNREASAWEAQVNAIDEAQKFYDFMAGKRQFAADEWMGDVSSTYDPSLHPEPIVTENERGIEIYEPQGNELEKAYYYANNWQNMGYQAHALNVNKYMFLAADPEILEMFNKFYAKDKAMGYRGSFGTNLAEQFLKGLDPYLTSMMVEYQNNYIQSVSQDPAAGTALRVMSPAFQAVGGVTGTLAAITGQDLSSDLYLPTRIASQTRARQNEDISELARKAFGDFGGDATNFMLGVVDSIADNVFAMGVGTALGGEGTKKAMRFVQAIMSGSATSNKMVEMLENGVQPTEAALYAVGDGVIEWLTERFSLEQIMGPDVKQLLGNKKALASFMARSAAAEGSEEINSSLLNLGLDYILSIVYGHEDQLKQKYNELITRYGMTDEEARKKVLMDQLRETGLEGLAGAMSGFAMAGSRVITNVAENRQAGRQVKKTNSSDLMLDVAKGMTEGTESRNLAEQLAKEMEAGEKISDSDLGRLARLTELEADEQYKNKSEAALKDSVMQEMEGKDLQGVDKEEAARVIVKAIKGGSESLSKAERDVLLKNAVLNIYKNYLGATEQTAKAIAAQMEATAGERKAQKSLAEIFKPAARTTNTGDNVVHGATAEEIRLAEQVSEHIKTGTEVLLDGVFQKLDGVEVTKDKDGKYSLQAVVDGKAVPAAAIKATGSAVGRIVGEASINPEFFSKQFTETLLKAQEEGKIKDPERNLNEAKQIRMYAYMGFQMPATSLDYKLASQIYKDSAEEHGQNRKAQAAEGNRKERGRITFDGVEYGTKEWNTKVKSLDSATRDQMDAIAGIAQRAGIEVDFTDLNDKTVYGSESRSGIRINVAGLNYGSISGEATSRHNMVVTFGHEMTHWLQRNSMRGYNRLEQFVMQQYRQTQGENELTRRLNHHMMQRGLSLEDAMSEIVADSCDQILANETVMQHIQETDKNLYTEVKGFVKNLVERIKQAVTGMSGSASRDARALAKSANEIAKVWLGAYDEALTGVTSEPVKAYNQEENVKKNQAETIDIKEALTNPDAYDQYFSYENLIKKDPLKLQSLSISDENKTRQEIFDDGLKNVKEYGYEKDGAAYIHIEDTNTDVLVSQKSLDHIPTRMTEDLRPVVEHIGELLQNSIVYNTAAGRKSNQIGTYMLLSAGYDNSGNIIYATFNVNRYTHKLQELDVLYTTKKATTKEAAVSMTGALTNDGLSPTASSVISLAEAFEDVKERFANTLPLDVLKKLNTQRRVTKDTDLLHHSRAEINNEGASVGSMVDDIDNMEQADSPSTPDIINDMASRVKLDQEYEDAANRGDIKKTTEMLLKKLADTQGVIPFMAPEWDSGEARETAKLLKVADPEAIATAADKMSDYVPDNAVLIPMPGREGKLTADSWSVKLAEAISERTGRPVVIALEGEERGSRQEAKHRGEEGASQEELGFRKVAEIPEGTFPIFVDNVVGKGVTADAAQKAMGGGITLAYTKTLRSPGIIGLKNLVVTHESLKNGGGLIPLSERLNVEKRDVRYSRSEESYDVESWLGNMTPSGLQTEDERILMETFKGLRVSMSLALHKQVLYQSRIKELESRTVLDADARHELETLRQKLEGQRWRMGQLEKEMAQVTSQEGYAGMMYKHNMLFKDFIDGKTQEQVTEKVNELMAQVKDANRDIEKQTAEMRKLAQTQAVKTMKSYLGKTSLDRMATTLKKQYNSAMPKTEVEDRLAYMALKLADGQDIQADAEGLAADLVNKMRGIRSESLEALRGTKFIIGQSLFDELKAENSTMKEIREAVRGSGVMFNVNQKENTKSRIVEQWNELRENNQSLPDVEGMAEIDALHAIVDYIASELKASSGSEQYTVDMAEATAMAYAGAASVTTFLVNDPQARSQIRNLMNQIKEISDKTGDIADNMEQLQKKMQNTLEAAVKVKGWSEALQADMKTAISYYNKTAAVAAQTERTKVKEGLIKQLRSENTRKLIAQQEKYRQMMKDDREARETAQKIQGERYKINTNIRRLKNLLTAETDQKNVPEEAKPLARMMSKMLVLHDQSAMRKVLLADNKQLADFAERLDRMNKANGEFDPERDLDFLVIKAPNAEDNDYTLRDKVWHDLMDIESGLLEYRNAEGQGKVSLKDRAAALEKIQKAVSEISTVIRRRGEAFISGKRYEVAALAEQFENEAQASRFKGERRGRGSGVMDTIEKALKYGNLTPEYFIKNLRNGVMSLLFEGFHDAEQDSGLEARDAQERMAKIAEETGFATWDGQQKHTIKVSGGREITITTEQLMTLYATWLREKNAMRPEATAHLLNGGFVLAESETNKGKPRREIIERRPVRMSAEQLDALGKELTDQQRAYVDAVIEYMSTDLAEIGNRASMDAYGIRKFTEKYYFPIKSWRGVMNQSSDRGVNNKNDNRAMRQSFTKRITAGAQNAIEISDFTPTAVKHIVGMITFNTVGPAVENLNKVLNQQLTFGEKARDEAGEVVEDSTYKTNMGAAFQEHYGKAAYDYLVQFMQDVNGGVTQRNETSLRESLLTLFKKSAVAGSLSVAAQQPLSYIRASLLINPKYLAAAISPQYWKGSYAEMLQYSGVAVIKAMGKFDMNYGRSMIDYITPEGMQKNKAKAAYEWVSDKSTKLPEIMDNMTWTRMWTAVKLEQAAKNPGVDMKSEAFLQQVAERFNELMRRTQVYDSVMVKSQNMRSTSYLKKVATSFMAEPTLSLNVLADAWQNIRTPGGKKQAAKALAAFLLSAAAQAGAKAFFGAGRSPDKKKTRKENFLNKFGYNLVSEVNPLGLIPGYSQLINVLADGELKDDAMGVIGKAVESVDKIFNLATGQTKKGTYRDLEDSLGQLVQYATNIPAKNIMRDFRAMVNWFSGGTAAGFTGDSYAQRETSGVVLKYQFIDTLLSEDLIGLLNARLMDAGYDTSAKGYVQRLYDAQKTGNKKRAEDLNEYLSLAFGKEQKNINSQVNTLVKADESTSIEEKQKLLKENEYGSMSSWVLDQYREGSIDRKKAEALYREERPKATDKDVLEALDKIDYEKRTGRKVESYSNYMPLYDAIEENRTEKIREALIYMIENGYKKEDIKRQLTAKYKQAYLDADLDGKRKIRDAIEKAYKAMGYTATDADKIINGWKSEKKK